MQTHQGPGTLGRDTLRHAGALSVAREQAQCDDGGAGLMDLKDARPPSDGGVISAVNGTE